MGAAETLGLPLGAITLKIGDSALPPSGPSGGSTTVGGVSSSTRKSTVNALDKLFEAVASPLGSPADQLEAVDGRIQVKGNSAKSLTWKAACQKLGVNKISEMGENNQRNPRGVNSSRVGGVQMGVLSADTATGIGKTNNAEAVRGRGAGGDPKTAPNPIHAPG